MHGFYSEISVSDGFDLGVGVGNHGIIKQSRGDDGPVQISGGHDIGKNDFGRPVALIAAALGVKPDVFREAFSGVTPARGRGPTGDEARKNKAALRSLGAERCVQRSSG